MTTHQSKTNLWQAALIDAVTDPEELFKLLELDTHRLDVTHLAAQSFSLKVPRNFIARMEKGNPRDPLLMQVLPIEAELTNTPGYEVDPLNEKEFNPLPGLLHKYQGRVLLTLVGSCAINCRYCFRRHFPYENNNVGSSGLNKIIDYIAQDATISEVILSGGDPLLANDGVLKNLILKLADMPHVKRLRIHSRIPIVLPERITDEFISAITHTNLKTVVVVHANHPKELNDEVNQAMHRLKKANITLLNQSVLLKGINDQIDILVDLSTALFNVGILPYYLHVLDKVQGTAHFDLAKEIAKELHWGMAKRLPGYLVPKLVCEQPGVPAKLSLLSNDLYTG